MNDTYQSIVESLTEKLTQKKIHHALLFYGERGADKIGIINRIVKVFIHSNSQYVDQEKQIQMFESYSHPDIYVLGDRADQEKTKITVDDVREMIDFTGTSSSILPAKFVIIDSIDKMNNSSANAILKILEEPRPNLYFFIICNNLNLVIKTILSRCIKISVPSLSYQEIFDAISAKYTTISAKKIKEYILLCGRSVATVSTCIDLNIIEIYYRFILDLQNKTIDSYSMTKGIDTALLLTIFVERVYQIILNMLDKEGEFEIMTNEKPLVEKITESNNITEIIYSFSKIITIIANINNLNNSEAQSWNEILYMINF